MGCTISQKIVYTTNDLVVSESSLPLPIVVDVRVFADNRANIAENELLFRKPRSLKINRTTMCINSERHYKKDTVVNQLSMMMVAHFNQARLFRQAYYNQSPHSTHYLTGTLNSFYGEQEFSTAAAIGAQFGLIGALATSNIKTPGRIVIDVSDLKLYNYDGTLVKELGDLYKEYNDDFRADAACWCVYWNANDMLKDFNTHLIEKIRHELAEINF